MPPRARSLLALLAVLVMAGCGETTFAREKQAKALCATQGGAWLSGRAKAGPIMYGCYEIPVPLPIVPPRDTTGGADR